MWRAVVVLAAFCSVAQAAPRKRGNMIVTVVRHEAQCGGAAKRQTPGTPIKGITLLIRRGKTNTNSKIVATVKTDKLGQFDVDLPKGSYCVITEDKRSAPKPLAPNDPGNLVAPGPGDKQACLDELARLCDAIIVAPTTRGRVDFEDRCSPPCEQQVGPAPASSKPV